MAKRYWLLKCEPEAYTIEDLERDGSTTWEGVRNFQARNSMRDDMKKGDGVLFYASNAEPSGVSGLAEVSKPGYPDPSSTRESRLSRRLQTDANLRFAPVGAAEAHHVTRP